MTDNRPLPGDLTPAAFERALELLEQLTATSSSSGDRPGLERAAEQISAELERRGLAAEIQRRAGADGHAAPLIVARSPSSGARPLLLLGHFDTVLEAMAPRRQGSRLIATGAIDMKGGIAAFLSALDLVAARGRGPIYDLLMVLVPDEEVAGPIAHLATREFGAGAGACWVLEPGEPGAGDAESVVVGRRGLVTFRLSARGRAAHSGLAFHNGRSAVAAACAWGAAAAALSRPGSGPTVNLARILGGQQELVEHPGECYEIIGSDRQINVVADRALIEGEYRFLTPEDGARLRGELERRTDEIARALGVELRLEEIAAVAPVEATRARLASGTLAAAQAERRGWQLELEADRGGISFPNFLPSGFDAGVLDGLGPVGDGMHTRDEFVDLRSYARRVVLLADLLEARASGSI